MERVQEETSRRALLRRPVAKYGIPILLVIVLAAIVAKPVYRVFRDWQVDRNVQGAREAFDNEDYTEARRLAMAVLNIRKQDYEMLRLVQRSMMELKDPRGFDLAISLMRHEEATEEDQLLGFQMSCEALPLASVVQLWARRGKELASTPEYLVPFVSRLIDQGETAQAAELLLKRSDQYLVPELRFQTIRMLMESGRKEMMERGQFAISDIMFNDGDDRMEAFRLLSKVPVEDFRSGTFMDLDEWVGRQAEAGVADFLLAKHQELQRYPDRLDAIISEAINDYAEKDPPAVARWLLGLGRFEEVLELVPSESFAGDEALFRARARALIGLERWQELHEWLETPPEGFPTLELHSLRLHGPANSDGSRAWRTEWGKALSEAELDRNGLLDLHCSMLQAGKQDLANEALAKAVASGRGRLPMWNQVRHLVPWLKRENKSELLFKLCRAMARLEPFSPEPVIELLDISLVLGKTKPESIIETLGKLAETLPRITEAIRYRETLATALVLRGKPDEALAALGDLDAGQQARSRIVAISAAAEVLSGDSVGGKELFRGLVAKEMLVEEVRLFRGIVDPSSAELPEVDDLSNTEADAALPEFSDSLSDQFSGQRNVKPLPEDVESVLKGFGEKKELPPLPEVKDPKLPRLPDSKVIHEES